MTTAEHLLDDNLPDPLNPKSEDQLILIVDDNPVDRELFSHLVRQIPSDNNIEILPADSIESALEVLEHHTPACCLVDFNLANSTGLDFLKTIRRSTHGEGLPVVIMTGAGDEKIATDVMRGGAQDYLVKGELTPEVIGQSITAAINTSELQNKLRYLAHYDSLTGLLNRSLFIDRMQTAIDQCDRYKQSCSLLFIDVDDFKKINDQYGHEAGDILLETIGTRIKSNCRVTDSPARLGGDEFAILLSHIDESKTHTTAEKILKQVSEPVVFESQRINVSLSIGVAHYPNTAKNAQDLMRQADEAMYRAKRSGKAGIFQFTQKQKQQWLRRNDLETLLPEAINNRELALAMQPIIDSQSQTLHQLEVLVRWFPSQHTILAPELIEMVEKLGLFDIFHAWLIDAALKQLSLWQVSQPDLSVCINIPANQCHNTLIVDCLSQAMEKYHIKPQCIELEVTETTLMQDPDRSHQLLLSLRDKGVRIAVDDFGAGYSSMLYLTTLPIDTLKIDQRFFIDIENNERNRKIIQAVTALGHSLGLKVVAEGVETEDQYHMARDIGCDYVQGYYFSKPQLATESWNDFVAQFDKLDGPLTVNSDAPCVKALNSVSPIKR